MGTDANCGYDDCEKGLHFTAYPGALLIPTVL